MTAKTPALTFRTEDLEAICRAGSVETYAAGEIIFSQGDADRSMFYVSKGEVELLFGEGRVPKTVSQGNFFGELAFILADFRRTATAKAKTDCTLVYLNQSITDVLIEENPHLLFTLMSNTCRYLISSEQALLVSLNEKNKELEATLNYLKKTREELDYKEIMALTDELTGLFNRRGLNACLAKFVEQASALSGELGLIMFDLDNFKKINDTWGHQHGDEVLEKVADIVRGQVRESDIVCRRGGDEFVILLPGISLNRGLELAENIRVRINDAFPADTAGIKLTASFGFARLLPGDSLGDILIRADKSLYMAKNKGRDQVVYGHSG